MKSEPVNGYIPAGKSCIYSGKECGETCMVSHGKTIKGEFSCGLARGLKLAGKK